MLNVIVMFAVPTAISKAFHRLIQCLTVQSGNIGKDHTDTTIKFLSFHLKGYSIKGIHEH